MGRIEVRCKCLHLCRARPFSGPSPAANLGGVGKRTPYWYVVPFFVAMMRGASFFGRRHTMQSLDMAYLGKIWYEERLRAAQQRRSWRESEWFRKLPRLAQVAVLILG